MIGEQNRVHIPNSVQVGYEIDVQIPIVNKTRHRLHYNICMHDQELKFDKKSSSTSLSSPHYHNEELEEIEEISEENISELNYNNDINDTEHKNSKRSTIILKTNSTKTSIESTQSHSVLKNQNTAITSNSDQSPFVFDFDKLTGELGPNEKTYLMLSFCPLKSVLYTMNVKCYLMCNNFQKIINILPVILEGSGCNTQLEVNIQFRLYVI